MGVLEIALDIVFRLGLPVFPCGGNKKPIIAKKDGGRGFHDATKEEDEVRDLFRRAKNAKLVGTPTGAITGFDILDIDYRNGGGAWELENAHRLPETRLHHTQSGGRHYLFKHAPGVRNSQSKKTMAPGVDVRGDGGYIIHPPSLGYHIDSDADIAPWPDWLLELVLKRDPREERPSAPINPVEISSKRLDGLTKSILARVASAVDGAKHETLRNAALSLGGIQQAAGFSDEQAVEMLIGALPSAKDWTAARVTAKWGIEHGRLRPLVLEDRPSYTNGHARPERPEPSETLAPPEPARVEWLPTQAWRDDLARSDTGKILRTLSNVLIAFRQAEPWAGVFAWNQFSSRLMVLREIPGAKRREMEVPREVGEADISNVTDWLQRNGIIVTSLTTREAIRAVAEDNAFHPVRDYLNGLRWDGVKRLDTWMIDHLGVKNNDLHRAFSARWMIGLVARVMDPGCQLDTAMILESRQGLKKSTALRTLAEPWFTDHVPELGNKDAMAQLQGVWIVELAELTSFSKAETHRIRSFLSTRVDRFRPSFGHVAIDHPRQCGFAGTVNPGSQGYLRDETGARRFWIVACADGWDERRQINVKKLAIARDQIWAETIARYRAGEVWWLDNTALEKGQEEAADERQADDPREPRIRRFVTGLPWVRMDQILGPDCLNVPPERWTIPLRMEIGAVMSALKWKRRRQRIDGQDFEWRYWPSGLDKYGKYEESVTLTEPDIESDIPFS